MHRVVVVVGHGRVIRPRPGRYLADRNLAFGKQNGLIECWPVQTEGDGLSHVRIGQDRVVEIEGQMLPGVAWRVPGLNARQRIEDRRISRVDAILSDDLHLALQPRALSCRQVLARPHDDRHVA